MGAHEFYSTSVTQLFAALHYSMQGEVVSQEAALPQQWEDASSAWADKRLLDKIEGPIEKAVAETRKITYQSGKGKNYFVPVLTPNDIQRHGKTDRHQNKAKNNEHVFPTHRILLDISLGGTPSITLQQAVDDSHKDAA